MRTPLDPDNIDGETVPTPADLIDALGLDRERVESFNDLAAIEPQAAGLVAGILERGERERERIDQMVREADERELQRWKDRALNAEAELDAIRWGFSSLLYPSREAVESRMPPPERGSM